MAALNNTVHDLMTSIGINYVALFNGATNAEHIENDMFNDNFKSFMDKTYEEIDADLKAFSTLTVTQDQIRLLPGVKYNLMAAVQWV